MPEGVCCGVVCSCGVLCPGCSVIIVVVWCSCDVLCLGCGKGVM